MKNLLNQLTICIERGKSDKNSPYPPDMRGDDGAAEITKTLLGSGVTPNEILEKGLMPGMNNVGEKFEKGEAFIPELLISAKAMNSAMEHLKPYFDTGEAKHRGSVIIGTVRGDLHDIGKNIVRMVLEGDGWNVIDLGKDVPGEQFLNMLKENPGSEIAISALLTTTMINMEDTVRTIKENSPGTRVFIGGAPLSQAYSDKIGADGYFPNPHTFAKHISGKL
ncbi:MAG: cobalamin-binding protein [bacterium]|nr:cobalamin-binding protein [bacterium]